MPTQNLNNLQGEMSFDLPDDGSAVHILGTARSDNSAVEGLSVNGGGVLNLMVFNRSNSVGDIVTLVGYRRLTANGEWSVFFTDTVAINTRESFRISGIAGFSSVQIDASGAGLRPQNILAAATISTI